MERNWWAVPTLRAHAQQRPHVRIDPFRTRRSPRTPTFPAGRREYDLNAAGWGRRHITDVYLAEQRSLHRKVAFKVLRGNFSRDEKYVRRFLNEARAAAGLVHANIVQVHEVGNINGVHFIAQEYVSGQNLRQLLTRSGGALDVRLAVNIMRQVTAALQKSAQHNVVHRDIKPENIMLAATGEVKVADFGLARVANNEALHLTQIGVTMGTPLYMSPEQVEGKNVDQRCDLYSLGVTCYHMLAGRPPFEGDTPLGIAVQHLKTEPARLELARPDLPSGLCRIVHKLLEKLPEDRYQQPADLLRDLRALQIEGVDEAWPTGLDEWTTAELLALHTARVDATRQLDTLMKTEALQLRSRRRLWLWPLGFALAFMIGGLSRRGSVRKRKSLLEQTKRKAASVEKKNSVQEQYFHALTLGTEQALTSVARFFPPSAKPANERYAQLAEQRLAELYLDRGDFDAALRIYEKLANSDSTDPLLRASGFIGQANVYSRKHDHTAAIQKLTRALAAAVRNMPIEAQKPAPSSNFPPNFAPRVNA